MQPGRRNQGLYFRAMVIPDEALSSASEDGSSISSPQSTFFFHQPPHMPEVEGGARYHVNPRVNSPSDTEIHAPQFDFAQGLNQDLQAPRADQQLVPPSSSAEWQPQVTFPQAHCDQPRRCQQAGHIFLTQQQPVQHYTPTATVTSPVSFQYIPPPSEQPSSGEPSHDRALNQIPVASTGPNVHIDSRHHAVDVAERTEPSMPIAHTGTSRQKGISHVIACRLCRARKIRCDSLRPCCTNCSRRSNTCEYDPSPKRRGPDKYPGTRQRRSKKRPNDGSLSPPPKRRRPDPTGSRRDPRAPPIPNPNQAEMTDSSAASPSSYYPKSPTDLHVQKTSPISPSPSLNRVEQQPSSSIKQESPVYHRQPDYSYPHGFHARNPYSHPSTSMQRVPYDRFPAPTSPMASTMQTAWWDKILASYSSQHIVEQFHFLASNATHQLCFINRNFLAARLHNEVDRRQIQPAFILAGLALAQLLRSSNAEGGENGMTQAISLRDQAQNALEEATITNPFNPDLAKAVFLLAVFESSAYKEYSYDRYCAALLRLDNVMRNMTLPTNDAKDPMVSKFAANAPPVINQVDGSPIGKRKCKCCPHEVNDPQKEVVSRTYELPWKPDWTSKQIHNEEIRRLCWCALSLMSEHITLGIAFGRDPGGFYLTAAGNFSLLFPGEIWDQLSERRHPDDPLSAKESVWALYCRSMLIWNFCVGLYYNRVQVDERLETVSQSMQEVDVLAGLLDVHACNIDTTIIYLTREYLFNTRLLLAQELRSGITGLPRSDRGLLYNTSQVQKWVVYQVDVVARIRVTIGNYNTQEGQAAFRRPFIVSWFVNQLHLCLTLWPYEQTMVGLLALAKDLLYIVDTLNVLWDCPANRTLTETLRRELISACHSRALPPPML